MGEINFTINYDEKLKDYQLGFDRDAINQLCQKGEKLIIIPIFGESGCGKSTITTFLISFFNKIPYEHNTKAGNNITSSTRGIDGSVVKITNENKISENILILDCEGFGGVDEETAEDYYCQYNIVKYDKKQAFLQKTIKDLLNISQYSFYVTDQTRFEPENINQEFKIHNKSIYLIFNNITKMEIIEKQRDINNFKAEFKSVAMIPKKRDKLAEEDFDALKQILKHEFETNEKIPDQLNNFLKFVNFEYPKQNHNQNYNIAIPGIEIS
ncbi:hypothetical protein ABPG74_015170 [Tetrahymena malaccensis]